MPAERTQCKERTRLDGRATAMWRGQPPKPLNRSHPCFRRSRRTDRSYLLNRWPNQCTLTPRGTVATALGIRRGRPGETCTKPREHTHFAVGSHLIWTTATSNQCKLKALAKGLGTTQKPPNRHKEFSPTGAAYYDSPEALMAANCRGPGAPRRENYEWSQPIAPRSPTPDAGKRSLVNPPASLASPPRCRQTVRSAGPSKRQPHARDCVEAAVGPLRRKKRRLQCHQ